MTSTYQMFAWPDQIGITFFLLSLILALAPYASGSDFGIFKIPTLAERSNKILRYAGPFCLVLSLVSFLPLWPPLELRLAFELTNDTGRDVAIHPWCDIDIYEPDAGGGIRASYPSYSRELQPEHASKNASYTIPIGKTWVFKTEFPIEQPVKQLYERSAGTIQVSFFDRDRKYLGGGAWKLSNRLKGISTLGVELH